MNRPFFFFNSFIASVFSADEDGVSSAFDEQWQDTWRSKWVDPYPQMTGIQWFPVLGNHDYKQGLSAAKTQVDRTKATDDDEWQFPSKTWTKTFTVGFESELVLIAIDTQEIDFSGYAYTEAIFTISDVDLAVARLEVELASAAKLPTTQWIVVMGHFPILSRGEHGDNEVLCDLLLPLFAKYGVDAYYAGHDHTMQHLEYADMHFVISGNGAKRGIVVDDDSTAETYLSSEYVTQLSVVDPGFTVHSVNASRMTTSFIDSSGTTIHYFEQVPRCKRSCHEEASVNKGIFQRAILQLVLLSAVALVIGCVFVVIGMMSRYSTSRIIHVKNAESKPLLREEEGT